jgi:hypothetical protein
MGAIRVTSETYDGTATTIAHPGYGATPEAAHAMLTLALAVARRRSSSTTTAGPIGSRRAPSVPF